MSDSLTKGPHTNDPTGPKPARTDGRNVDPGLGTLEGEGSQQRSLTAPPAGPLHVPPSADGTPVPGYYGLPLLKSPVWIWAVPTYFYVGGVAGATSMLGAAARVFGGGRFPTLVKRSRWVGLGGDAVSAALLIHDLGRPSRFLNMLRVFRPTSPMSVGSWVLAASGACNLAAATLAERPGALGALGTVAEVGGGVLGLPLTGYTAVLLANTAVPVWQGAHRSLPFLFMGSAAATAGALFQLMDGLSDGEQRLARRFMALGQATALMGQRAVEQEIAPSSAAAPLRSGTAGTLWTAARALTAASLALTLIPGEQRWKRRTAGLLGTAGGLALRFALFHAGKTSAKDPSASFHQQRAGLGAAEVTGLSAVTGPNERALREAAPDVIPLPVLKTR